MSRLARFAVGLGWTGLYLVLIVGIDQWVGTRLQSVLPPTSALSWLVLIAVAALLYAGISRRLPAEVPSFRPSATSALMGAGLLLVYAASMLAALFVIGDGYLKLSSPSHLLQTRYLALLVCAALTEELLFRGLLMRTCMIAMPMFWAVVVQALLFAALHLTDEAASLRGLAGHVLAGVVFARAALLTGSTVSSTILHAGMNIFSGALINISMFGGWGVAAGFRIDRAGFITFEDLGNIRLACLALLLCAVEALWLMRRRRCVATAAPPRSVQRQGDTALVRP